MEFHGKVLQICMAAHDMVGAAEAHGRLGRIHVEQGDLDLAIERHEQQVAVASAAGPEAMEQKRDGQRSLVSAYGQQAEAAEKAGDTAGAIATHEKCLEAARQCGDVAGEGLTQHRLGMTLAAAGETERAMQCQRLYRDACAAQQPVDLVGQGKACQALAAAAQAKGDTDAAANYLEDCIELASRAEDTAAHDSEPVQPVSEGLRQEDGSLETNPAPTQTPKGARGLFRAQRSEPKAALPARLYPIVNRNRLFAGGRNAGLRLFADGRNARLSKFSLVGRNA